MRAFYIFLSAPPSIFGHAALGFWFCLGHPLISLGLSGRRSLCYSVLLINAKYYVASAAADDAKTVEKCRAHSTGILQWPLAAMVAPGGMTFAVVLNIEILVPSAFRLSSPNTPPWWELSKVLLINPFPTELAKACFLLLSNQDPQVTRCIYLQRSVLSTAWQPLPSRILPNSWGLWKIK